MPTAPQAESDQPEREPNGGGDEPSEADRPTPVKLGDWLVFLAAVGVLVIGVVLLWNIWRGWPVATAFTRVGGATRVETAVEASRFWLTPPRRVVMTPAGSPQQIMLGAAQCAMVYDAPLLFTPPHRAQRQLVRATIDRWRNAGGGAARRVVIKDQGDVTRCLAKANLADGNRLRTLGQPNRSFWLSRAASLAPLIFPDCARPAPRAAFPIRNRPPPLVVPACVRPPHLMAFPSRARPAPLVVFPEDEKLAPVVVFAAAKAPGALPDVAVGLALAAHMATAGRSVSLVVVPRYLEADPKLEGQLRKQRQVVEGGIVLGSARVLPADTRELLRQLLTSTDRQGVLGELRTNLGAVGPLIAALLAILGLGTAAQKASEIRRQAAGIVDRIVVLTQEREHDQERRSDDRRKKVPRKKKEVPSEPQAPPAVDWLTALGLKDREVTVWLRTGRKITGTANGQYPAHEVQRQDGAVTLILLNDAKVTESGKEGSDPALVMSAVPAPGMEGPDSAKATEPGKEGSDSEHASAAKPKHEPTGMFVWVSVEDIELIGTESQEAVSGASGAESNQPAPPTAPGP